MRVISGVKKGHKLKYPKTSKIRPTEDRIKESIFNIISPIKLNSKILDLYAGSGAIGIEFLSRGGGKCYFVDNSKESISYVKKNINHTKLDKKSIIIKDDSLSSIESFKKKNIKFDYIYIDPPYKNKDLLLESIKKISNGKILNDNGLIILEHEIEIDMSNITNSLTKIDSRKYGKKIITFIERNR